mgnify:CR=1 FL=1
MTSTNASSRPFRPMAASPSWITIMRPSGEAGTRMGREQSARAGRPVACGALLGLAVVLILVSMFYQKFLAAEAEKAAPNDDADSKGKP